MPGQGRTTDEGLNLLPTGMSLSRGLVGVAAGTFLLFSTFVELLSGNWQLGFAHDWALVPLFGFFVPAVVGILSPAWYWIGRPLWHRVDRSSGRFGAVVQGARFLPGLAGTVTGLLLVGPVTGTSGFWMQVLFPFGLLVGLGTPVWYWLLRPLHRARGSDPGPPNARESLARSPLAWGVAAVLSLLILSVLVTTVISIPVLGVGESVTQDGLAVTVTDVRRADAIQTADGDVLDGGAGGVLLVEIEVENRLDRPLSAPGSSIGDLVVLAGSCRAQTFGEPSNNCNRVYVDREFTADDRTYTSYELVRERAGGTVAPGERLGGWLAYRIERTPADGFRGMVIVEDAGRWRIAV